MGMFIAARFIGGVGASMGTGPYLIAEIAHPQHRPIATTIYNSCYFIGSIIAAWATYGTLTIQSDWAWRLPSLLQAVTPLLQLSLLWFVPESPRFLINKDRHEEARAILERFHGPCSGPEFVQAEYDEICQTIALEKQFSKAGWKQLWSTKGNRHRLAICIALGFFANTAGNTVLSYYLHQVLTSIGVVSQRKQLEINGVLTIFNWVIAFSASFFVDMVGRRPMFLTSVAGMLFSFIGWTACAALYVENNSPAPARGVLACIFIYTAFYSIGWSGLYHMYATEILPYSIRAKGVAAMVLCAYSAVFFANYVNPVGLANAGWKWYLLYDCWLVVIFTVIYFLFPETKNTPLEEIAKVFDGDDALVGGGLEMSKKEMDMKQMMIEQVEEVKS
jgi:sugar porter (SP) family MFS transporter